MPEDVAKDIINEDDPEFDKFVGQFRLALNIIMNPLRMYGQQYYTDSATQEIVGLALQLHWKLSGLDEMPYLVNHEKLHW